MPAWKFTKPQVYAVPNSFSNIGQSLLSIVENKNRQNHSARQNRKEFVATCDDRQEFVATCDDRSESVRHFQVVSMTSIEALALTGRPDSQVGTNPTQAKKKSEEAKLTCHSGLSAHNLVLALLRAFSFTSSVLVFV